ncbi:MAG: hypothetical protein F6K53_33430 [Moorea sp. SIO4A1]|uniref:hypothetical protein n=1 Tax=Moorena sp. SIO4A1 TaxID=2607835 RepID=UPI00144E133D|nr:hypothetical protein [Moorena sp. SIO4A1]NEQ62053.1 hypothetical protein [Moorena sp. SIO4A1]
MFICVYLCGSQSKSEWFRFREKSGWCKGVRTFTYSSPRVNTSTNGSDRMVLGYDHMSLGCDRKSLRFYRSRNYGDG